MKKHNKNYLLILGISFILIAGSCIPKNEDIKNPSITETPNLNNYPTQELPIIPTEPIADQEDTPVPETTPIHVPVTPDYKFEVIFDNFSQSANIQETIHFSNNSFSSMNEIILACDTLRYPGAFQLQEVILDQMISENVQVNDYFITIPLTAPLDPGKSIEIQINYILAVPPLPAPADDQKPGIFGYSSVQTNFVDWYPFIPPQNENGEWILHEPGYYGEYLVYDLANFDVSIDILNSNNNTLIAASTIPFVHDETHYSFTSKNARNFVWSVGPSYIFETIDHDGITISSYSFPFHQFANSHLITETSKAIDLYSRLYSPYPRKNLTIVEADFLDGMEYDGLFFLSRGFYNLFDNTPQNYLTMIAVHETAHQWWYTSIANDQAIEPWLDEALCTYSEYLFYEEYYPELVDWWWEYRVNYYQPDGYIDMPIYDYQGFIPYRDATYLNGAKFLQYLRDQLGDQTFFDFLHEYATIEKDKITSEAIFFTVLSNYSNFDFKTESGFFKPNQNQ